jgi:hypothetical protein
LSETVNIIFVNAGGDLVGWENQDDYCFLREPARLV